MYRIGSYAFPANSLNKGDNVEFTIGKLKLTRLFIYFKTHLIRLSRIQEVKLRSGSAVTFSLETLRYISRNTWSIK